MVPATASLVASEANRADAGRLAGGRDLGELADSDANAWLMCEETEMERETARRGHPVTPQGRAVPPK